MKTKITMFAAMLFLGISAAFATTPDSLSTKMDPMPEIRASIEYPQFASEQGIEGTVYLRLELLENGHVNIIQANCANNELLRYVVDKVETMKFDPEIYKVGEPFNMKFSFTLFK